jgi:cobalamin-dependent methionine synthase I
MELLEDFDLTLSEDDVLRGEGADPQMVRAKKPALLNAASAALVEGFSKLHTTALIETVRVVEHQHKRILFEGGNSLVSPLVARHLAGAEQVVLVVCTIGKELEELASTWMEKSPLLGVALDGLGNAAIEFLGQQVCLRIGERAQGEDLTSSTPLSPGEPEWPVEVGQPQIFALLDPSQAGISLTTGGMMVPKKSISFVVGIGPEMNQSDLCELCSLRERCRYRHA